MYEQGKSDAQKEETINQLKPFVLREQEVKQQTAKEIFDDYKVFIARITKEFYEGKHTANDILLIVDNYRLLETKKYLKGDEKK